MKEHSPRGVFTVPFQPKATRSHCFCPVVRKKVFDPSSVLLLNRRILQHSANIFFKRAFVAQIRKSEGKLPPQSQVRGGNELVAQRVSITGVPQSAQVVRGEILMPGMVVMIQKYPKPCEVFLGKKALDKGGKDIGIDSFVKIGEIEAVSAKPLDESLRNKIFPDEHVIEH